MCEMRDLKKEKINYGPFTVSSEKKLIITIVYVVKRLGSNNLLIELYILS